MIVNEPFSLTNLNVCCECLAQMARTFLFLYVYSIPFALLSAVSKPIQSLVLVFIVTYGFLGLEYVTIELEDPFGDDPSDLPVTDLATGLYEDCCIVIADKDGVEAAKGLLQRVLPVTQVLPTTENSPLV
jgi:predicted membrane chloride channel (bestrophin family)